MKRNGMLERKLAPKAHPRKVNFFDNHSDFLVYMLASAGLQTDAISELTNLTISQVTYRLYIAEKKAKAKAEREGRLFYTARRQYRKGTSQVSRLIVNQITNSHSQVKKFVKNVLDKRGLYTPLADGVMK